MDEDLPLYIRQCRDTHFIIRKLGEGQHSGVWLGINKDLSGPILARFDANSDAQQAKDELRVVVEAVKIAKGVARSLKAEIEDMQALQPGNFPNIAKFQRADPSNKWMSFESLKGRTIEEFIQYNHTRSLVPSIGLAWHMIYQLCEALLGLQHGRKGGQGVTTGRFAHHDLDTRGNIMLRPSGGYRDYPDVVLIDLGIAKKINRDGTYSSNVDGPSVVLPGALGLLEKDIRDCGNALFDVFFALPEIDENNRLFAAIEGQMMHFEADRSGTTAVANLIGVRDHLTKLRDEAFLRRQEFYQPLGDDIKDSIQKYEQIVSDGDLERILYPSDW